MRASDAAKEPKHGRTRPILVGSVLVAGLCALWWITAGDDPAAPRPGARVGGTPASGAEGAAASQAPRPRHVAAVSDPVAALARAPLPESLRGTDVDGGLTVDADGAFVPTPDAIALFDYFLAASGEESEDVIRARIVAHIRGRLDGAAARDAEALLAAYLGFRDELRELASGSEAPRDLERRLQWVRELRRKHFGADVAEALFGESEAVTRIDLERRRVALDANLDPAERSAQLAALTEQLPESVRVARRDSRAPQRLHDEVAALRRAGASAAEVFALREGRFGREAAERLAALDTERAAWEQRLESYRVERDLLLVREDLADLSHDAREARIDSLRREHFDEHELARVRALERFGP